MQRKKLPQRTQRNERYRRNGRNDRYEASDSPFHTPPFTWSIINIKFNIKLSGVWLFKYSVNCFLWFIYFIRSRWHSFSCAALDDRVAGGGVAQSSHSAWIFFLLDSFLLSLDGKEDGVIWRSLRCLRFVEQGFFYCAVPHKKCSSK